jgi:hypothetical protein
MQRPVRKDYAEALGGSLKPESGGREAAYEELSSPIHGRNGNAPPAIPVRQAVGLISARPLNAQQLTNPLGPLLRCWSRPPRHDAKVLVKVWSGHVPKQPLNVRVLMYRRWTGSFLDWHRTWRLGMQRSVHSDRWRCLRTGHMRWFGSRPSGGTVPDELRLLQNTL